MNEYAIDCIKIRGARLAEARRAVYLFISRYIHAIQHTRARDPVS